MLYMASFAVLGYHSRAPYFIYEPTAHSPGPSAVDDVRVVRCLWVGYDQTALRCVIGFQCWPIFCCFCTRS
jgi:hypothetical protein